MAELSDTTRWPASFVRDNAEDAGWLAALPGLIEQVAERWSLRVGPHFPDIRINYVGPATRADGTPCVLKVSRHIGETRTEIAALQFWNGHGAARLLDADPDLGALLLERLEPGTMLSELAATDDDAATLIAAGVLRQLWRPAPAGHALRSLESWCAAYDRNRAALTSGAPNFPAHLFRQADDLRRDLLASTSTSSVLHGDLHHFNVLRAQRAEWLAIDPKGLVGDPCFDVCQFLLNPHRMPADVSRRRLDSLCSELGLDRQRTTAWCLVHAVLNACWDFEDGVEWQPRVAYAEQTLSF
jgi:streptomycin 6-kinase